MEVSGQLTRGGFTTVERAPGTHWIGGWVGPISGLDAMTQGKKKSLHCLCWEWSISLPARNLVTTPTKLSRQCTSIMHEDNERLVI